MSQKRQTISLFISQSQAQSLKGKIIAVQVNNKRVSVHELEEVRSSYLAYRPSLFYSLYFFQVQKVDGKRKFSEMEVEVSHTDRILGQLIATFTELRVNLEKEGKDFRGQCPAETDTFLGELRKSHAQLPPTFVERKVDGYVLMDVADESSVSEYKPALQRSEGTVLDQRYYNRFFAPDPDCIGVWRRCNDDTVVTKKYPTFKSKLSHCVAQIFFDEHNDSDDNGSQVTLLDITISQFYINGKLPENCYMVVEGRTLRHLVSANTERYARLRGEV